MSADLPTIQPRPSSDLTITPTHREVMRRLDQGESLTEAQVDTLGALYLHELVDDLPVEGHPFRAPALTSLGRRVLDVGGVLTTRQERPRLVSRPMPERWTLGRQQHVFRHHSGTACCADVRGWVDWVDGEGLSRAQIRTMARDLLALIDWLDHEDAVRAQDGES